jgi:hypothetical protein
MSKLSPAILERIQAEADRLAYGKITIIINENVPEVDILVEERLRYNRGDKPRPGTLVTHVQRQG